MPGSYCRFCGHRCFVDRVLPADASWKPGEWVHLATCTLGAKHDLAATGYDHRTAINPVVPISEPSGYRFLGNPHRED
jgi:hypothetical protein